MSLGDVVAKFVVVEFVRTGCLEEVLGYEVVLSLCLLDSDGLWSLAKGSSAKVTA